MATRTNRLVVEIVGDDKSFRRAVTRSSGVMSKFGGAAKIAGAGVAAGLGFAVKSAATFEKQMDALGAVSNATGKQMNSLRKQAIKAGADTMFSAREAAEAQTELAKGGLSVAQIMRGGLSSSLALAAAGEMELAEAAEASVNAMKLFGLRGRDAMKVADGLATAANTTTADVSDFAMALKQGGSAAKSAGLDFTETVSALEALAGVGIKGSDAGTSLKAMLAQLAAPTAKQEKLQKKLNLEWFDSQGNMKSLVDISRMLGDRFDGLTKKQQLHAAKTLAGTDGMRAMLALFEAGPEQIAGFQRGLEKQGTAATVAKQKQDNLAGSIEELTGSAETLAIQVGTHLIPFLTRGARAATEFINGLANGKGVGGQVAAAFSAIGGTVSGLVSGFREGDQAARTLAAGLAAAVTGFVAFKVVTTIAAGVEALKTAFNGLTGAMAKNPAGAAAIALAAVASALGVMSIKTDTASASTRGLTDAMRAQADALRAVRDIDIDVAQRKANVRSATVAVAQAERNLSQAKKQAGKDSLAARQAEADLQQARVNLRRATRELGDSEDDARVKRQKAREATVDTREETNKLVESRQRDVRAIDNEIDKLQGLGRFSANTGQKIEALRKKQESLREEIERLKSKRVTVAVDFKLNPAPQAAGPNGQQRPGDGWGVEDSLRQVAQGAVDTGKLLPGLGSLPIGGTGLNAFNAIAARFGLTIGSGFRPGSITSSGNLSYHAMGRARDFPGTPAAMMAFAQFMAANFGSRLKELIYTPLGFSIKNGARVSPYAQAQHFDHVHVAMRKGGEVPGSGSGDRVPAMLEPGEFVIKKNVVDRLGPGFFAGINGMRKGGRVGKKTRATMQAIAAASQGSRRLPLIEQSVALAELTTDLGDDTVALDELVRHWEGRLAIAKASGHGVTDAARGLKSARDQRAGLTPAADVPSDRLVDAIEESNRLAAQKIAIDEQLRDNQLKILALKDQGDQIVAAVVAAVNGGIGGSVGLGFHGIRSTPGSVAAL